MLDKVIFDFIIVSLLSFMIAQEQISRIKPTDQNAYKEINQLLFGDEVIVDEHADKVNDV